jgi:ribosomal protein S18 acetylase RimI-like enzyme
METIIRKCTLDDLHVLRDLARDTYDESFRQTNTPETMDAYLEEAFDLEKIKTELEAPQSEFYFLFADGQLAGYIKVNDVPAQTDINDPTSLELERIYVKKEFKRLGLGSQLIDYAEQLARLAGKEYVWLGVWEQNPKAIAFYESMGYAEFARHTFRMGEELQSDLVMKKIL